MRIAQRALLEARPVHEAAVVLEPAVPLRLLVERGAGIRRRERHLEGVGIDLLREADRLSIVSRVSPGRPRMNVPWIGMPSLWQSSREARARVDAACPS